MPAHPEEVEMEVEMDVRRDTETIDTETVGGEAIDVRHHEAGAPAAAAHLAAHAATAALDDGFVTEWALADDEAAAR